MELSKFEVIKDKYFEYDQSIYKQIHTLKEKISNLSDLKKLKNKLKIGEKNYYISCENNKRALIINLNRFDWFFMVKQFIIILKKNF